MNRFEFHKLFKCQGPAVLPVVHVLDRQQTERNVRIAAGEGAQGVFLINHDFDYAELLPTVEHIRGLFPGLWLGVNFLAVTGREAFPVLEQLRDKGVEVDGYWADDACIDEHAGHDGQAEALAIDAARSDSGFNGLYFGGTAFKSQRLVEPNDYRAAARQATGFMDVVTTSGVATGKAIEHSKVDEFRAGCGSDALAIASGVTPDNAHHYVDKVDCILVATGISREHDFYNLDAVKLRRLLAISRRAVLPNDASEQANRRYLAAMAPNVKGEKFAWLDPSTLYINAAVFHTLLDDLAAPFDADEIDVVAGFDAMGFVLAAALATHLRKGFLTLRKSNKLPVPTDSVEFVNYSGRSQRLEIRKPAFEPGARVLVVDQWVETGATMAAGIELLERQGATIAGVAAVCIEESKGGLELRNRYKCATAVLPGSDWQRQCNEQRLASFENFDPAIYFPSRGS